MTQNRQYIFINLTKVLHPSVIGPLQLAIHVEQNRRAGEQNRTGTRQTKGIHYFKW